MTLPVPPPPRAAASLERRLPLLMSGVLAVGLAAFVGATYAVLRARAADIVTPRLRNAALEVARTTEGAMAERLEAVGRVARDPALAPALDDAPAPGAPAAARAALAALLLERDTLPAELWNARGGLVLWAGRRLADGARPAPPADGRAAVTPLAAAGGRARFWVLAPVHAGDTVAGWVALARRVGSRPGTEESLRRLTNEEVSLYTRNADGSTWATTRGEVVPPPTGHDTADGHAWAERAGVGRVLVGEAAVAGTPWVMTFETPASAIHARPRRTLQQLWPVALVVLAGGAAGSWAVGRRITRPLRHLTRAVEELAAGTYEHPVRSAARDEVGRLAASFDAMARQVVTARGELERRAADAQAAAAALSAANVRLRRTSEEAERARAEADRANRAKGDFLAMMSHELRTPLNAIGGYAELLAMGIHGPVTPAQAEALSRIARSQAHLLTLINDVLSFARIDAGQVHYAMGAVPLGEALAGLEPLLAPQLRARRQRLTLPAVDPALAVHADADKLRQLLLNLLGNAVKYTPEGGSVAVACDADDALVRVHVRDTGVGIAPDRLRSIFEPFVQGERALNRPTDGVGLGLAISRELAQGMGGTLDVESEVGRGSTFTVTLARATARTPQLATT